MLRKFIPLALLTLGVLLQTSPVPLRALDLGPAGLTSASLPAGAIPVKPPTEADLNSDSSPESLSLTGSRLAILSHAEVVWQSPIAWQVSQAEITDLDHNGTPEVTLLVWRSFRPWPVDQWLPHGGRIASFHNANGNSCQLILIGWRGSEYGELWAGSALAEPVTSFATADLNGDNAQELVTLEGTYTDPTSAPARALKVWEWNGFGFTVVSKIEGAFTGMALVREMNGHTLILVP